MRSRRPREAPARSEASEWAGASKARPNARFAGRLTARHEIAALLRAGVQVKPAENQKDLRTAANEEGGDNVGTRVVLADDHPLFLEALTIALEGAGITVVGTATRGDQLVELVESLPEIDAVLLDLKMPGYDGFECIDRLRRHSPDVRLIVISATDDETNVQRALERGAVCFIGKSIDPNDLAAAVRALLSDAIHLGAPKDAAAGPAAIGREPGPATSPGDLLTRRELEILKLASSGLSNAQMAQTLWVTEQTVKFHLSNIYRKIGVGNRTGASRWAQQHGLLDDVGPGEGSENWRTMRALPSDTP